MVVERLNETNTAFEAVDYIETFSNDDLQHVFTVYDTNPLEGDNFYRMKVVFDDGTEMFSEVKKVNFDGIEKINIFPNPANKTVIVDLNPYLGKEVSIFIYDQFGQEINRIYLNQVEEPLQTVDVEKYNSGTCFFRIVTDGRRDVVRQVVVQH